MDETIIASTEKTAQHIILRNAILDAVIALVPRVLSAKGEIGIEIVTHHVFAVHFRRKDSRGRTVTTTYEVRIQHKKEPKSTKAKLLHIEEPYHAPD